MTNIFAFTGIISLILAAGAIEDCNGACMGQENYTVMFICLTIAIISVILTISTMKKETKL
jgi:uncharacterized membrane protein